MVLWTEASIPLYVIRATQQTIISGSHSPTPLVPTVRGDGDEAQTELEVYIRAVFQIYFRATAVRGCRQVNLRSGIAGISLLFSESKVWCSVQRYRIVPMKCCTQVRWYDSIARSYSLIQFCTAMRTRLNTFDDFLCGFVIILIEALLWTTMTAYDRLEFCDPTRIFWFDYCFDNLLNKLLLQTRVSCFCIFSAVSHRKRIWILNYDKY